MDEYQNYGEYTQQSKENGGTNTGTAIKFLLLGIGVGAAAALLFSPMSGREVREAISHGCRNAIDGISQQTRNLRERGSNLLGFNRKRAGAGE